ncbi:hypothetical protein BCR32DRAFT_249875 [Anaeromyces robustus]|uniref:Uncharacterized protein n=1 Tax=Anaeromyces robustus TaxID=1754192 RepID=A0A1Y1WJ57_9FUNG|nr:hypothetical protein BCR32DRAFT_249875 [Anaeromyces robustus]|eukprot:ORX73523.1 hypothetical protein BCR32DRAFT_249875 [Anaeromyces robustus]
MAGNITECSTYFKDFSTKLLDEEDTDTDFIEEKEQRFNKFKSILENIFTNYLFPNNFDIYITGNNTETSNTLIEDLSYDIINNLYDLYLKINHYVDNSNQSIIDLVLQKLLIS